MTRTILALVAILAAPAAAGAQDFGVEWLDRVIRDREPAQGPLSVRPLETSYQLGAVYLYDSNLFLEPSDTDGDSVVIGFARVRLDYAAPRWDAAGDLLINYNYYLHEKDETALEERAYGRIRYVGPKVTLEATEIFRHESDPIDAVFAERAERFVSITGGRAAFEVLPEVTVEANAQLGLVFFRDNVLDDSDNWNARADVGGAWKLTPTLDFVAQVGWLTIDTQNSNAPDAQGYYARGGVRGEPLAVLSVVALAGVTRVTSDRILGGEREEAQTADIFLSLRYEPMRGVVYYADYSRQVGFAGPGDPFQVIDRAVVAAEWQATPQIEVRGRFQYDRVHSALGLVRTYWSLGPTASYAATPQARFELGLTLRRGDLGIAGDSVFDDVIAHIAFIISK